MDKAVARPTGTYVVLVILSVFLGLLSRSHGDYLPEFLSAYAGDTLWASMVFFLCCLALRKHTTRVVAGCALCFCFVVEFSQLYQALWINELRATTLGALVLGHGFLWSDLICYSLGVALGVGLDRLLLRSASG